MCRSGGSTGAIADSRRSRGFTLIELVITLAVFAILIVLAVPAFTTLVNNNRLTAQANELVADIQTARSEAVKRNQPVTLCPSTDNATCTGADWGNRIMTAPAGAGVQVLRISTAKNVLVVRGGVASIVFRPDGFARNAAGALLDTQFTVCLPTTSPERNTRQVQLATGSRLATSSAAHTTAGACPP